MSGRGKFEASDLFVTEASNAGAGNSIETLLTAEGRVRERLNRHFVDFVDPVPVIQPLTLPPIKLIELVGKKSKYGAFTLNPDEAGAAESFDPKKYVVGDSKKRNTPITEAYVDAIRGKTVTAAGLEYLDWLLDHPEHIPSTQPGEDLYFLGSLVGDESGRWRIPYLFKDLKGEWHFGLRPLVKSHVWNPKDRSIMLHKKIVPRP